MKSKIEFSEFEKIDVRVGVVKSAEPADGLRVAAHRMVIDFGPEIGEKTSLAQITNYPPEELVGKQVLGVVNFEPRRMGKHVSEVLTLGVPDEDGKVILVSPDEEVPPGAALF